MIKRKYQIPKMSVRANFSPGSIDTEARTVELVFSVAGSRVLRQSWFDGPYYEELSLDPSAVRMDRLNNGAPLLNTHASETLDDQIGVVERAWLEPGLGKAIVRFSRSNPKALQVWQDVQDGIVRNVSVGYATLKFEQIEGGDESTPVYLATDWEPMELSLVPIPADAGAGVRSAEKQQMFDCELVRKEIVKKEGSLMLTEAEIKALQEKEAAANQRAAQVEAKAKEDALTAARAATKAATERAMEITTLVRKHGLDVSFGDSLVSNADMSLDGARAAILDKLAEKAPKIDGRNADVTITTDEVDTMQRGMEAALLHRYKPEVFKLDGTSGAEYRGMSLKELAREHLEKRGISCRGKTANEIAAMAFQARGGMHTTSDFPTLLANIANKTLRAGYQEAPAVYDQLVTEREVADFREISSSQLGDFPALEKVNEHGEFKRGSISEGGEKYKLGTYGKIVAVTRQVIINDDLGAFTQLPEKAGIAARSMIADSVFDVLNSNPIMADGFALFSAQHGNLFDNKNIKDGLSAMRTAMKQQRGLNGARITISPKWLLTGVERETEAEQVVSPLYTPIVPEQTNVFARKLLLASDPRLAALPYFLVADKLQASILELAFLQGQRSVYLETRMGFDVDGMELKARLDYAVKAIDWRGIVKNLGVTQQA